jgi:excisionase family DNA binding protein
MAKSIPETITVDPSLDAPGIVARLKEWGFNDASVSYVRYLWDSGALPHRKVGRKRRTPRSVVDRYVKITTQVKL